MSLRVNLRQLEKKTVELEGEMTGAELELEGVDELIQAPFPLTYELTVELIEDAVLAQGNLSITLLCECARCLKKFEQPIELEGWAAHLELKGEEKVAVEDDSVDLTPSIREDILLAFPQHPLCKEDCRGLLKKPPVGKPKPKGASQSVETSSAWSELNKLKFEKE
jgi:uncharacterized protein